LLSVKGDKPMKRKTIITTVLILFLFGTLFDCEVEADTNNDKKVYYEANTQDKSTLEKLCSELEIDNPKHGFVSSKPASKWEESMISGNGTIGVLFAGAVNKDRIVLSHERLFLPKTAPVPAPKLGSRMEETRAALLNGDFDKAVEILEEESAKVGIEDIVWTNPHIPACQIEFESLNPIEPTSYARSVNYETGEAKVAFKNRDVLIHQDAFVSRTKNMAIVNFSSPSQSKLSYKFRLNQLPNKTGKDEFVPGVSTDPDDYTVKGENAVRSTNEVEGEKENEFNTSNYVKPFEVSVENNVLTYTTEFKKKWDGSLKSYAVVTKIIPKNGTTSVKDRWIQVENADEILLLSTIELFYKSPTKYIDDLVDKLDNVNADYASLLNSHVKVHSEIFNRYSFNLGKDNQLKVTAEELLASSSFDNINPDLIVQQIKACRYNSICSTGKLPPTLQGIWGGTWFPAWSGDFTLNGNVPSAIAAGLNTNHQEITEAYLNLMDKWRDDFKYNARELFGKEGIFVPSRGSDMGNCYTYNTDFPMLYWWAGAPWASHYFYDYWLHTGDSLFLKNKALPFMLETYTFIKEILYKHNDEYIFVPSYSPEIAPIGKHPIAINATMDVAVVKQLLRNLLVLAEEGYIENAPIEEYKDILENLPKYAIAENGELKEWIWQGFENDNEHRHASHLYPLYDGIDPEFIENPALMDAAKKAIESRLKYRREDNGAEMAFGLVQLGIAAAHLKDVDHAYECVKWLSSSYWTPAFVSYHDPGAIFNLDISGGLPAVLTYMLIQSTVDEIELLPALPAEWPDGEIKGALARGGFVVDFTWKDGKPVKAKIESLAGNKTKVLFNGKSQVVDLQKGENMILTGFSNEREKIELTGTGWKAWIDNEASWQNDKLYLPDEITNIDNLPHNMPTGGWSVLDELGRDCHIPATIEELFSGGVNRWTYHGVSWFWKDVRIPAAWQGKTVHIVFADTRMRAEVYVNSDLAGYDLVAETPWEADISSYLKYNSVNRIAIRLTNPGGDRGWQDFPFIEWGDYKFPHSHDFTGIGGAVTLVATDAVYIDDIFIKNELPALANNISLHVDIRNKGAAENLIMQVDILKT
jgi:hypothetical protein